MKKTLLLVLIMPMVLTGCKKENIHSEDLYGTWRYDSVQLMGVSTDSTVQLTGTFKFEAPGQTVNAGGTVYGDFCKGRAEVPIFVENSFGSVLYQRTDDILLTKSNVPDNYNYSNFYYGTYGYNYQGMIYYFDIRMCLVSKNEMNMQFWLSANSYIRFNVQKMTLKRI